MIEQINNPLQITRLLLGRDTHPPFCLNCGWHLVRGAEHTITQTTQPEIREQQREVNLFKFGGSYMVLLKLVRLKCS